MPHDAHLLSGAENARKSAPVRVLCPVVWQREEGADYFRLRLQAPGITRSALAGQFLHILPHARGEASATGFDPLLRRAFSIMRAQEDEVEVLYRAGGRGTNLMRRWREGDVADVLGPLGRGFGALVERNLLVGGGVGVPPMVMLAQRGVDEGRSVTALIGGRRAVDVLCLRDFASLQVSIEVATEDESMGARGRVTELLLAQLQSGREATKVFACGPLPMLRAVHELCARYDVACEVSLEEAMPCGVGVCNGCVVPVVPQVGGDECGSYRRICVEGPVVPSGEVDWSKL